jgi:hypothetical protein
LEKVARRFEITPDCIRDRCSGSGNAVFEPGKF